MSWDRIGKTDPAKAKAKPSASSTSGNSSSANSANHQPSGGDGTVWNALQGRNWQRDYDIQVGNIILLRRSTDEPAPPGTTVILRWRTPQEYDSGSYPSSKGRRYVPMGKFKL